MDIIEKIFERTELKDRPPVLLDIGASGQIYRGWKRIAKYSTCIAFDADEREMKYIEDGSSGYKKLYIYNQIVTASGNKEENFFLTRSPYCSSLLEPDIKSLEDWNLAELFEVERKARLKTTTLPRVLSELKIHNIDWFKTDSQGTDLRLFQSLGDEIIRKILVADFEPGFIDAYKGEDKLHNLLAYMDRLPFWINELVIPQTQRLNRNIKEEVLFNEMDSRGKDILNLVMKSSPMCGEISYLNTMKEDEAFDLRDFLLMWVSAFINGQLGFALEIAHNGEKKYGDPIFAELKKETINAIDRKIKKVLLRKPFKKLIKIIKGLI
jgi:hypothetical protein